MNMEHLWKKSLPYICGALAVALAYTILYCLHPVLYDDWNYLEQMQGFLADPSPRSWWHDFSVGVIQRYSLDNIRLANILYLLICPLPQWIPSVIAGAALFITFLFGARLAGVWRRNLFAFAAMIALYMCIEPWYEGMLLKTFAFNYSLPSALALWSARMILRQKPSGIIAVIPCAYIIGLWHEAFTISILGGILLLVILYPRYRSVTTATWSGCLILAILTLYLAPGTALRSEGMSTFENLYRLWLGLRLGALFYLFFIITLIIFLNSRLRKQFLTPRLSFIFGASIAGWGIWRCFMGDYRPAWSMLLFSAVGIAYFIGRMKRFKGKAWSIAGILIITATVIQISSCIPWAARMRTEAQQANRIAADGLPGHFCHRTIASQVPLYTMNRVNFDFFACTGYPWDKVVPEQLRDFNPADAEKITDRLYRYRGHLVAVDIPHSTRTVTIELRSSDGSTSALYLSAAPFTTAAGTYTFLAPLGNFLSSRLGTSEIVRITDPVQ